MKMKLNIATSLLVVFALVACGGDDDGGTDAGNAPDTNVGTALPTNLPAKPPVNLASNSSPTSYKALDYLTKRSAMLAQLKAQGAQGFHYFGTNTLHGVTFNLYAKDSDTTFCYEILDKATTADTFLAQLNAQGAKGFEFKGSFTDSPYTTGTVYSKESNAPTYTYEMATIPYSAVGFLNQSNAKGAKGFLYIGSYAANSLYRKISTNDANYTYRLENGTLSHTALITQANNQGQTGFKFSGQAVFDGSAAGTSSNIYVKDISQTSNFEWKTHPAATKVTHLVAQANAEGAANFVYWFSEFIKNACQEIYFKPTHCSGVLCRGFSSIE
jgi:hypothetical protein